MVEFVPVRGYDELKEKLSLLESSKRIIYMYFYGEKDGKGQSWCPDCVEAEESIMTGFRKYAADDALVLVVDVGGRAAWKDLNSEFRKPPIAIQSIPALLRWQGAEKLDGDKLLKDSLLELFFEEAKSK